MFLPVRFGKWCQFDPRAVAAGLPVAKPRQSHIPCRSTEHSGGHPWHSIAESGGASERMLSLAPPWRRPSSHAIRPRPASQDNWKAHHVPSFATWAGDLFLMMLQVDKAAGLT